MRHRVVEQAGSRVCFLVLDSGDEVMEQLAEFARYQGIGAGSVTGIGAFSEATLAFFDPEQKRYDEHPVAEQVEVLSLLGDLTRYDGEPHAHVHAVLGRPDGSTVGGHLLRGRVRPTLEVVLTELPTALARRWDADAGLALIDLSTDETERG